MTRIAIHLTNIQSLYGGNLAQVIDYVELADRKGVDQVALPDHVAVHQQGAGDYPHGNFPPLEFPWYEPLVTLAGIATRTRRIRLSTGIMIAPLRQAVLLAKQLATLDVLSGGRVDAGFGVGWQRQEYDACGVPFEGRFGLLEEQIAVCRTLWRDAPARFDGKTIRFEGLHCEPRPLQAGGIPIWLGFTPTPRAFERIARCGDGWIRPDPDPVKLGNDIRALRAAFVAQGRPASAVTVRSQVTSAFHADGTPDIAATLARAPAYIDAGVDILEFYPGRLCRDASELVPLLDAIIELKQRLA